MNMMKKNGGFTLVELIVVIAILAILAGVAVPAYSGYIAKANEAADYTMLDAVKTAGTFAAIDKYNNANVVSIEVAEDTNEADKTTNATVKVTIDGTEKTETFNIFNYVSKIDFKSDNNKAVFSAADAKWTLSKTGS